MNKKLRFETRSLFIVEHLHIVGVNKKRLSNKLLPQFYFLCFGNHVEPPEVLFFCSTQGENTQMPNLKNPTFPYVTLKFAVRLTFLSVFRSGV